MCFKKTMTIVVLFLLLTAIATPASARTASVDCSKNQSLAQEIGKLDRLEAHTITITGNCNEDVEISGYTELRLVGLPGAGISAANWDPANPFDGTGITLNIVTSHVTIESLSVSGGIYALYCDKRSTCIIRDVVIEDAYNALFVQGQSNTDVIGATIIRNNQGGGATVAGASTLTLNPNAAGTAWPIISGNSEGIGVWNNSYVRSNGTQIVNNGIGVWVNNEGMIQLLGSGNPDAKIDGSGDAGVWAFATSTVQIRIPVTNNPVGLRLGPLSYASAQGFLFSGNGIELQCGHPSAVRTSGAPCP